MQSDNEMVIGLIWVLLLALVLYGLLRVLIDKDKVEKVGMLALGISFTSISIYFKQKSQSNFSYPITVFLNSYIFLLACIKSIIFKNYKSNLHHFFIIKFSLFFLIGSGALYIIIADIFSILSQDNALYCFAIVPLSLYLIHLLNNVFKLQQQAIKRKLFHIGPIIIVPIVYGLNQKILLLILCLGFYVFFVMEMIRYHLKQMQLTSLKQEQTVTILDSIMINTIKKPLDWMNEFNTREKHFWFTHLFLILSLIQSYSPSKIAISQRISPHVVLALIAADGLAALIGKKIGKVKIYGQKTMEGSCSFFVAFYICYYIIISNNNSIHLCQQLIVSLACSLAQLFGGDADNLTTLFAFYISSFLFRI